MKDMDKILDLESKIQRKIAANNKKIRQIHQHEIRKITKEENWMLGFLAGNNCALECVLEDIKDFLKTIK